MGSVMPDETVSGRRYRVRFRQPNKAQTDERKCKTKREADVQTCISEGSNRGPPPRRPGSHPRDAARCLDPRCEVRPSHSFSVRCAPERGPCRSPAHTAQRAHGSRSVRGTAYCPGSSEEVGRDLVYCSPKNHSRRRNCAGGVLELVLGHNSAAMTLAVSGDLFEGDLDSVGIAPNAAGPAPIVITVWTGNRVARHSS